MVDVFANEVSHLPLSQSSTHLIQFQNVKPILEMIRPKLSTLSVTSKHLSTLSSMIEIQQQLVNQHSI